MSQVFYGCSTVVLIGFTCPAITVVTVILRALVRVRERALGAFCPASRFVSACCVGSGCTEDTEDVSAPNQNRSQRNLHQNEGFLSGKTMIILSGNVPLKILSAQNYGPFPAQNPSFW